jgi:hypothetical protein
MKINLNMKDAWEPEQAEVLGSFELFGFTFCVTHPYFTDGFDRNLYVVTEYTTGLKVGCMYENKKEAIDYTKILLLKTGEEEVKQKVEKAVNEWGILNRE